MKEIAGSIRLFVGSAFTTCVIALFFVPPKSPLFFTLFAVSIIMGMMWLFMLGVTHS